MFKRLICLVLLCGLVIPMSACEKEAEYSPPVTTPAPSDAKMNLAEYTIVYGDGASAEVQKIANRIKNKLRTQFALDIPAVAVSASAQSKEILVGTTARAESTAALAKLPTDTANAYRIEVAGEKIIIAANSDTALDAAVQYFINALINKAKNAVLELPADYAYNDSFGVSAELLTNGVQIKTQLVTTIYGATKRLHTVDLSYARIIELSHNGNANGMLLATSESLDVNNYLIHRSVDYGATWETVGKVSSQMRNMVANWQPMLYELPCQVGDLPEGTILLAGCIRNSNTTKTNMVIYKSNDFGVSWDLVSVVDSADGFSTTGGLSKGLWEPFLLYAEGKLWCYYSDEKVAEQHSQRLVCRSSTDGVNWSDTQEVVALEDANMRPGMITVTKLGDGRYLATYEIVGMHDVPVYFKITDDLNNWNPADIGKQIKTKRGEFIGSAPYICWTPAGGECGTLLVTANHSNGKTDEETCYLMASFDYGDTWVIIDNPLSFKSNIDARNSYSPGFFVSELTIGKVFFVNTVANPDVPGKRNMELAILEISNFGEDS